MKTSDLPPTRTIEPIDAPPDTARPTSAMLKADIDSGRSGDKVPVHDPGLSPLGTDDEAAGHSPGWWRVALARQHETLARWRGSHPPGQAHARRDGLAWPYIGFVAAAGLVLAVGIWLVRTA